MAHQKCCPTYHFASLSLCPYPNDGIRAKISNDERCDVFHARAREYSTAWPDDDGDEVGVDRHRPGDAMMQAFRSLRRKGKSRPYDEIVKKRMSACSVKGEDDEEAELLNPGSPAFLRGRGRSRQSGDAAGFSESVDVYFRPRDNSHEYADDPWIQRSFQR